jgi:hypothetical protein
VPDRRWWIGAVVVAVLSYGWWFTDRRPFSPGAFQALLVAAVVLIVVATVRREHPPDPSRSAPRDAPHYRAAIAVWSALTAAVVAWELIALRSSPRSAHPTISSLTETAEHHHIVRLALFAVWMWFGWRLAS